MTNVPSSSCEKKCSTKPVIMLASLALNIFLVAFLLGRVTNPGMMPPPPDFFGADGGKGGMMREARPFPPPPFFGPDSVFSKKEMDEHFDTMRQKFEQTEGIRNEFAERLKKEKMSKEDIRAHFTEMEKEMSAMKREMMEKVVDKIDQMDDEERKAFATRLLEKKVIK